MSAREMPRGDLSGRLGRSARVLLAWWVSILVSVLGPRATSAQEPAAAPEAQASYEEGVRALERDAPVEARVLFERAVEQEARGPFVLALAATLQELGEPTAAVRWYTRLLDGEFGALDEGRAAAISAARESARAQQAVLSVRVRGGAPVEVELDDERIGSVGPGDLLSVRVDAGVHRLRSLRDGEHTDWIELSVTRGEQRALSLEVPPPGEGRAELEAPLPAPLLPPLGAAPSPSLAPWFLVGVAAVPLVVGIATGVLFQEQVDLAFAAPDHASARPHVLDAEPLGYVATISFSLAGVMALVGLVWGLIEWTPGE